MSESTPATSPTKSTSSKSKKRGKYSRRNLIQAQKDIKPDAPEIHIGGDFIEWNPTKRGNARVTLNHGFIEIVAHEYRKTIYQNRSILGIFDQEDAEPLGVSNLSSAIAAGLSFSTAVKLVQATPQSEKEALGEMLHLSSYKLHLPRTFHPILDLIGKTDYNDWKIRVEDNPGLTKRLFLKSIKHMKGVKEFESYNSLTEEEQARLNQLDEIGFKDMDIIFFDDIGSVKKLKSLAEEWLSAKMNESFKRYVRYKDENGTDKLGEFLMGYPPIPRVRNKDSILAWLASLNSSVHPDAETIGRAGVLLLADLRWMERPTSAMKDIDRKFTETPVSDLTPIQLLNACGLHHYTEFLSKQNFFSMTKKVHSCYCSSLTVQLKSVFAMMEQGTSTLGSPAQLVLTYEDIKRTIDRDHPEWKGFDRVDLDRNATIANSFVDYKVGDQVTRSAMVQLVKEVELDPDYEGKFRKSLVTIRENYLARDAMISSQARVYD